MFLISSKNAFSSVFKTNRHVQKLQDFAECEKKYQ